MLKNLLSAAVVIGALRASLQENLILIHANNKGVALPAHLGGLISAFVIYLLERSLAKLLQAKVCA